MVMQHMQSLWPDLIDLIWPSLFLKTGTGESPNRLDGGSSPRISIFGWAPINHTGSLGPVRRRLIGARSGGAADLRAMQTGCGQVTTLMKRSLSSR